MIFEHAENGAVYHAMPFQLETATGSGILITEESVYDVDDNLIIERMSGRRVHLHQAEFII